MTLINRIRGKALRTRTELTSRTRRTKLFMEELEARVTPTVIFHPYFGPEATTIGSGEKLNHTPVELIFWGSTYWSNPTGASASTIASSISKLLSSPAYQHLSQYGAGGSPYLANWWVDTDHGDPNNPFTDADLTHEIVSAINDTNSSILPPSNFSSTPLYMVITPYGTYVNVASIPADSHAGDRTVFGYHFDVNASTNYGNYNLVYGWTGQPYNIPGLGGSLTNIDSITSVFSHESSEAMTDAQPFSGVTCKAGANLPGGGSGEIGDFEPEDYNLDEYRVDGVLVQAMWDNNAQAFTVSDGNSQHVDLYANYTESGGTYTYTGSTLDIYGDQLAARPSTTSPSTQATGECKSRSTARRSRLNRAATSRRSTSTPGVGKTTSGSRMCWPTARSTSTAATDSTPSRSATRRTESKASIRWSSWITVIRRRAPSARLTFRSMTSQTPSAGRPQCTTETSAAGFDRVTSSACAGSDLLDRQLRRHLHRWG